MDEAASIALMASLLILLRDLKMLLVSSLSAPPSEVFSKKISPL